MTRGLVLEWVPGIVERDLPIDVLATCEEAFLTSTSRDVHPIARDRRSPPCRGAAVVDRAGDARFAERAARSAGSVSVDRRQVLTYDALLREHARSRPHQVAVVDGDVSLRYPELDARVDRLAGVLVAEGVGDGERVLWLGQNSFRILELLLACARVGAVLCPANWRQSAAELRFVIEDFTPRIVVWQEEEVGDAVRAAREQTSHHARWIRHDTDAARRLRSRPRRGRATRRA